MSAGLRGTLQQEEGDETLSSRLTGPMWQRPISATFSEPRSRVEQEHKARAFWDAKILSWERKSYRQGQLWGLPLRWRRQLFLELVGQRLRGKTVFEMGCGSAGLLEDLFSRGIRSYVGCDISTVAIHEAKNRAAALGLSHKVELVRADVLQMPKVSADFGFSLGLLDWLDDEEAAWLLALAPHFLHSFSERRLTLSQLLHRAYVYCAYGNRDTSYVPRYRRSERIAEWSSGQGVRAPEFYRDSRMSFSTFAYCLPAPEPSSP